MTNDIIAISNNYKKYINPSFILQESFSDVYKNNAIAELQEWYEYDVQVLNHILVQEGLGDMIKNVGQKIGGAVKGVGDFALKKLASALGKVLKMAMPSEEEAQKLQQEVEKLKDPNFLSQQAAAGNKLLGGGESSSEASEEEMYENNRRFLLSTVFSEANIIDFFNSKIILEAKAGRPKGSKEKKPRNTNKPTGKVNVAGGGVQKANMAALDPAIMELISVVQQMKGGRQKQALNRIARTIAKKTKLNFPVPYPKADKQAGQEAQQSQAAGQDNQLATTGGGSQLATTGGSQQLATTGGGQQLATTGQNNQLAGQSNFRRRTGPEIVDAEYTDVPADKALPSSGGDTKSLFQKIMGYIKAHPRITSTIALALIGAVTAASGGALLPLVITGLTTGGVKAGVAAYQSNKQDGKVNWNKTVDALFTGTAQGAGAAAFGQAAKGLMGLATSGGGGAGITYPDDHDIDDNMFGDNNDNTHDGGLGVKDAAEAQADAETNAAQYPQQTQVNDDLFKQYNKTPYNPKSPLDQAKKAIMQKLSDANNGQIPASQYNNLASKAEQLIKQGKKSSAVVSQLFPESYTVNYLRYF